MAMNLAAAEKELVETIAEQAAACADEAVERWMTEFESVLQDHHLTTVGRLQAMTAIVARYRYLRGYGEGSEQPTTSAAGCGVC